MLSQKRGHASLFEVFASYSFERRDTFFQVSLALVWFCPPHEYGDLFILGWRTTWSLSWHCTDKSWCCCLERGEQAWRKIQPFNSPCPDVDALTFLGFHKLQPWTSQQPFSDLASVPLVSTSSLTLHLSILRWRISWSSSWGCTDNVVVFCHEGWWRVLVSSTHVDTSLPASCVDFSNCKHNTANSSHYRHMWLCSHRVL